MRRVAAVTAWEAFAFLRYGVSWCGCDLCRLNLEPVDERELGGEA